MLYQSMIHFKSRFLHCIPKSGLLYNRVLVPSHTGIFKGSGYSSRLWLQFLKDVATGKNGRFAREFSGKSTTNAHFTEIMLSKPI